MPISCGIWKEWKSVSASIIDERTQALREYIDKRGKDSRMWRVRAFGAYQECAAVVCGRSRPMLSNINASTTRRLDAMQWKLPGPGNPDLIWKARRVETA